MSTTDLSAGVNVTRRGLRSGPSARTLDTRAAAKEGRPSPASALGTTPCLGKSALFDAVDFESHAQAKALCMTCPVIAACSANLAKVLAEAVPFGGPEGTWAGRGLGLRRVSSLQMERENSAYSKRDAEKAHGLHRQGNRSEWINTGERVYQRRAKWRQKKARQREEGAA